MQNNLEINYYEKFIEMANLVKELRRKHPGVIESSKLMPYLNEMAFYVNALQIETMEKSLIIKNLNETIYDLKRDIFNDYVDIK